MLEILGVIILLAGVIVLIKTVRMVPQGSEWTVERFGKYTHTLSPGLHLLVQRQESRHPFVVGALAGQPGIVGQGDPGVIGGVEFGTRAGRTRHAHELARCRPLADVLVGAAGIATAPRQDGSVSTTR